MPVIRMHRQCGRDMLQVNLYARPNLKRPIAKVRSWPSRARQLSELLTQNRPVRTCPLSDCSRAMKLGEGAPAPGH